VAREAAGIANWGLLKNPLRFCSPRLNELQKVDLAKINAVDMVLAMVIRSGSPSFCSRSAIRSLQPRSSRTRAGCPKHLDIHLVMDSCGTHETPAIQR